MKQKEQNSKQYEIIEKKARIKENNIFMIVNDYLRPNKNNYKMKLKFYDSAYFNNVLEQDIAIMRVVARNKDIMFCLEGFYEYDQKLVKTNISNLRKIIAKVARDGDLDRIVYIRVFNNGENTVLFQKGYCDENHEFNEDILDLITVFIEPLLKKEQNLSQLDIIFKEVFK